MPLKTSCSNSLPVPDMEPLQRESPSFRVWGEEDVKGRIMAVRRAIERPVRPIRRRGGFLHRLRGGRCTLGRRERAPTPDLKGNPREFAPRLDAADFTGRRRAYPGDAQVAESDRGDLPDHGRFDR